MLLNKISLLCTYFLLPFHSSRCLFLPHTHVHTYARVHTYIGYTNKCLVLLKRRMENCWHKNTPLFRMHKNNSTTNIIHCKIESLFFYSEFFEQNYRPVEKKCSIKSWRQIDSHRNKNFPISRGKFKIHKVHLKIKIDTFCAKKMNIFSLALAHVSSLSKQIERIKVEKNLWD